MHRDRLAAARAEIRLLTGHRASATCAVAGRRAGGWKLGRPRQRPDRVLADRGYDHDKYRRELWARGVKPLVVRCRAQHASDLRRQRWVGEGTIAWLHH